MNYFRFQALACACLLFAFLSQPAAAQTATNVVCNGCVGSADIADGSVTTNDLTTNAVRTGNLARSSVTLAKLSPGVQAKLNSAIADVNFEFAFAEDVAVAAVGCPAETFAVSASCGCSNNDGLNNFGVLFFCATAGDGVVAGCFSDGVTYDAGLPEPIAQAQATCMAATSADGAPWVPFANGLAPSDGENVNEPEWREGQRQIRENMLIEQRNQADLHKSRIRN